jgi:hypothetical protein
LREKEAGCGEEGDRRAARVVKGGAGGKEAEGPVTAEQDLPFTLEMPRRSPSPLGTPFSYPTSTGPCSGRGNAVDKTPIEDLREKEAGCGEEGDRRAARVVNALLILANLLLI